MCPRRIAIATDALHPDLVPDDQLLLPALEAQGITGVPVVWNRPADWPQFDAVLIRSTWDYWHHYPHFLSWLQALEDTGLPVWNSAASIRWNSNKIYLRNLEAKGIPTIPTLWIPRLNRPPLFQVLDQVLEKNGWNEAVVKPTLSGGAFKTYRVSHRDLQTAEARLNEVLLESDAMIQPLMSEVLNEGEVSFIFFEGQFSHAVIKQTKPGDFRIQESFGGTTRPISVSPEWVAQATRVLEYSEHKLLYARVDMIESQGKLLLMELESTEPSLFFKHHLPAVNHMAAAIKSRLASAQRT